MILLAIVLPSALFSRYSFAEDVTIVPAFNPATATIVATAPPNAVWMTRDPPYGKGDSKSRAPEYRYQVYVQKVGADTASLGFEIVATGPPAVLTVLADETVVLQDYLWIVFAKPGALPVRKRFTIGSIDARAVQGWPDGILVQFRTPKVDVIQESYFVPIKNRKLDDEAAIPVTPEDRSIGGPSRCVRHNRTLGWVSQRPKANGYTPDWKLHLFDLDRRNARTIPLDRSAYPFAIDDKYAFLYKHTIDLATGKRIADPPFLGGGWMAIHEGIGYVVFNVDGQFELRAYDFFAPKDKPLVLSSFPVYELAWPWSVPTTSDNQLGMATDTGITIWTGQRWETFDWIKRKTAPQKPTAPKTR